MQTQSFMWGINKWPLQNYCLRNLQIVITPSLNIPCKARRWLACKVLIAELCSSMYRTLLRRIAAASFITCMAFASRVFLYAELFKRSIFVSARWQIRRRWTYGNHRHSPRMFAPYKLRAIEKKLIACTLLTLSRNNKVQMSSHGKPASDQRNKRTMFAVCE